MLVCVRTKYNDIIEQSCDGADKVHTDLHTVWQIIPLKTSSVRKHTASETHATTDIRETSESLYITVLSERNLCKSVQLNARSARGDPTLVTTQRLIYRDAELIALH